MAKAKAYLNSSFVLNLDTSSRIAGLLVQLQIDRQGIDYFTRRPQMINAVSLDDARRVAKRLLDHGLLITEVGRPGALAANGGGVIDAPSRPPLDTPGGPAALPAGRPQPIR